MTQTETPTLNIDDIDDAWSAQDIEDAAAFSMRHASHEWADPDDDLSPEERDARDAGIARGEADFAAGRLRSLEAVKADKRSRFGIPV